MELTVGGDDEVQEADGIAGLPEELLHLGAVGELACFRGEKRKRYRGADSFPQPG
jgi:hypothetical protein